MKNAAFRAAFMVSVPGMFCNQEVEVLYGPQ
jgi:hypothetical protein